DTRQRPLQGSGASDLSPALPAPLNMPSWRTGVLVKQASRVNTLMRRRGNEAQSAAPRRAFSRDAIRCAAFGISLAAYSVPAQRVWRSRLGIRLDGRRRPRQRFLDHVRG